MHLTTRQNHNETRHARLRLALSQFIQRPLDHLIQKHVSTRHLLLVFVAHQYSLLLIALVRHDALLTTNNNL